MRKMSNSNVWKLFFPFALIMLFFGLNFGVLAAHSYTSPGILKELVGFIKLRPMHVSSVIFWILLGATGSLYLAFDLLELKIRRSIVFWQIVLWIVAIVGIFYSYFVGDFGGREYWEYPPIWSLPLLIAWVLMVIQFFLTIHYTDKSPVYFWMWGTGLSFFVFVFLENYLWMFNVVRADFIKDTTLQWKVNGSLVGCWNQLIYGTSFFLMEKITGDTKPARSKLVFFMYFLGLFNLMFNWSHHIYTLPTAKYIRYVGYIVSMTEWLIFFRMIWTFRSTISASQKHMYSFCYKFLIAAECWVFINLFIALLMSIPVINLFTHGTHITVAHAMGTTIGINTMILFGAISFSVERRGFSISESKWILGAFTIFQFALFLLFGSLIVAGVKKALYNIEEPAVIHTNLMLQLQPCFRVFSYSGSIILIAILPIMIIFIKKMFYRSK